MRQLAFKQTSKKLSELTQFRRVGTYTQSWINFIRSYLGMKSADLAQRTGLAPATVFQAERREAEGKVNLETLRKMADAMECDFIYAFVPRRNLEDVIYKQAKEKAKRILKKADLHMTLEDQKVSTAYRERVERLTEELIRKGKVW